MGRVEAGCWSAAEARLLVPLLAGTYRLRLAAPPETRPAVAIRWGKRQTAVRPFEGILEIPLLVAPGDREPDGMVRVAITVAPALRESWKGGRELGVFLVSLSP